MTPKPRIKRIPGLTAAWEARKKWFRNHPVIKERVANAKYDNQLADLGLWDQLIDRAMSEADKETAAPFGDASEGSR